MTHRETLIRKATDAESVMLDEYAVWKRGWEANPTLDALRDGILAIRALVKYIETTQ